MAKQTNTVELINPEGVAEVSHTNVNIRHTDLENKTVLLHWNGKHNGDVFLSKIAELILHGVNNVHIVKGWEAVPETAVRSYSNERSKQNAAKLAELKPDLVIGAMGD